MNERVLEKLRRFDREILLVYYYRKARARLNSRQKVRVSITRDWINYRHRQNSSSAFATAALFANLLDEDIPVDYEKSRGGLLCEQSIDQAILARHFQWRSSWSPPWVARVGHIRDVALALIDFSILCLRDCGTQMLIYLWNKVYKAEEQD